MSIRQAFHKLIDEIDSEETISAYHDLLSQMQRAIPANLIDNLSDEQKKELDLA